MIAALIALIAGQAAAVAPATPTPVVTSYYTEQKSEAITSRILENAVSGTPIAGSIQQAGPIPTSTPIYISFSVGQTPVAIYTPNANRYEASIWTSPASAAPTAILNWGAAANPTVAPGISLNTYVSLSQTVASQTLNLVSASLTPVVGVVTVWQK